MTGKGFYQVFQMTFHIPYGDLYLFGYFPGSGFMFFKKLEDLLAGCEGWVAHGAR
jgi:hypothetical protein